MILSDATIRAMLAEGSLRIYPLAQGQTGATASRVFPDPEGRKR